MGFLELVIAGVVLSAVGLGLVKMKRARETKSGSVKLGAQQIPEKFRTIQELRTNDVILLAEKSYIIGSVRTLAEAGKTWVEAAMSDGDCSSWISLAENDTVMIGERVDDLDPGAVPPAALDYRGKIYQLKRHGFATLGESDPANSCAYWQYARAGDGRLSIRRADEATEVFVGTTMASYMVEWLPGS